MKYIVKIAAVLLLFVSCEKAETEILNMMVNPEDIVKVEIYSDHRMLLPNGKARTEFFTRVYARKTVPTYGYTDKDIYEEKDSVFLVPNDQVPAGLIKIYDEKGNVLKNNTYSTTNLADVGKKFKFYAKVGAVKSGDIELLIRPLPEENYEEIVVPIIFHVVLPPKEDGLAFDVTSEYMQKVLDRINQIYNGKIPGDPNGGNAKVTFKLALYNPKGTKLDSPGKNEIRLSQTEMNEINATYAKPGVSMQGAYDSLLVKNSNYRWDHAKYLNIWLVKYSSSTSETGSTSYDARPPKYIATEFAGNIVPGITTQIKDVVTYNEVKSCFQIGFFVNLKAFLNPQSQSVINQFSLATPLGYYFGLLTPKSGTSYPKSDPDYCDDTNFYYASSSINNSVYKSNASYTRPEGVELSYFTSFNVMDIYTRGYSISVDQAARMRDVMKKYTDRWSYKSNFAFTGK